MDRYDLSRKQHDWLESLSGALDKIPKVHAFMAKGPATVAQVMNMDTGKISFRPKVRGVNISMELFDKEKDAFARAESRLAELRAMTDLPVLDEVALGIDDTNYRIANEAWEASVRVDEIYHLGAMMGAGSDALPDGLTDLLDELSYASKHKPEALKDLKGLDKLIKDSITEFGRRDGVGEALSEYQQRHGTYGFLVKAATPVMNYAADGKSASFTWGYCHTEIFYGETFQEAFAKAVKWADDWKKKEKVEAKKKAQEVKA